MRERSFVEKACCHVSVEDVEKCIGSLKCHKAPYLDNTIRYDTRCYFNVRSKADISQLNLPHGTDN